MSWFIYSTEALPNPELIGKPGYTPDNDYIKFGGAMLPCIPKGQWIKLPDSFTTVRHTDWKDKQGTESEVGVRRFKPIIDSPDRGFAERGVIMVDHEPVDAEKKKLEHLSAELNLKFRKKHVEFYENQRQIALARQGAYPVTPYTDECYEILGMNKPYSVDALQALRDPGARAAQQIADAISEGQKANATAIAEAVQEALTRPKPDVNARK
jgi:hypothetical protein